jgi:hypothetical protein
MLAYTRGKFGKVQMVRVVLDARSHLYRRMHRKTMLESGYDQNLRHEA